jgi:hypothetical protein
LPGLLGSAPKDTPARTKIDAHVPTKMKIRPIAISFALNSFRPL